jgi:hypothetical protein
MKAKIFVGPPNSGKSIVAEIIIDFVGRDKTYYKRGFSIHNDPFFFDGIKDETELIIIDDCKEEFPYHLFFNPKQKDLNSEIVYPILVNKQCHWPRFYLVKNVILITNSLDSALITYKNLLKEYFDITHFPLSKIEKTPNP